MARFRLLAGIVLLAVLFSGCQGAAPPPATEAEPANPTAPIATRAAPTIAPAATDTVPASATATPLPPTIEPTATEPPPSATPTPTATALPTIVPEQTQATPEATSAEASSAPTKAPTQATALGAIIVDHTSVELFESIPDDVLERARKLRVIYYNASVGNNLSEGLNCLAAASWSAAPAHCRRDYSGSFQDWQTYRDGAGVPAAISFSPDPVRYNRDNWIFGNYPGDWQTVTRDFITTLVPQNAADYDVLSYKFTYLMVTDDSDIADPNRGFFADQPERYDVKDFEKLMAEHPDKRFFLWTSSLSRSIGTQVAVDFNEQMRRYAQESGIPLFDIADIEAHNPDGQPCYDNRDGVQYCTNNGECENQPDDGLNLPAICQNYTTEIEGGHLGSVSAGKLRVAKGFWVLMARIAGWNP